MKRTTYVDSVPDFWPIKKALTNSDVDITHPFLTLPRQQVETHIIIYMTPHEQNHLRAQGQVNLNALDNDTGDMYLMNLKWRGSYYNLIGKWGKIVRGKALNVGHEIKLKYFNNCLFFSVSEQQNLIGPAPPVHFPAPAVRMIADPPLVNHGQHWPIHDDWPIRKVLTLSDVDINHPFLTLPGKAVEDHVLFYWGQAAREQLRNERQVGINARDGDTGEVYLMKLRWRGSYYNLIGKWGKIIREKMLTVGTEIRVRWDNGCLVFSVA